MKFYMILPLILLIASGSVRAATDAKVVSMAVGQVKDHVVTSREVRLSQALEGILYGDKDGLATPDLETPAFSKQVTTVLLEWVVYLEAKSLAVASVTDAELKAAKQRADKELKAKKKWSEIQASPAEVGEAIGRKLLAKKLIRFRADSAVMPISETEAQRYFEQNRLKFGNLPYENFRANIKTFLARQQVEKRLKDWFEVLQAKYQARNFLAEI